MQLGAGAQMAKLTPCNLAAYKDQMWELSSFSEAAMAVGQAPSMSTVPASSQPR